MVLPKINKSSVESSDNNTDKDGNRIDEDGNRIDKDGNRIDKDGNILEDNLEEDDSTPAWDDTKRWTSCIKSLFSYFILTIIYGMFASNFIYITSRGKEIDSILPTFDDYYSAKKYRTFKFNPLDGEDCNGTPENGESILEDNFPYNLIIQNMTPEEILNQPFAIRLQHWYGSCAAGCFKACRAFMKDWLDNFNPSGLLGNHAFQIIIGFPFTALVGLLLGGAGGFITSLAAGTNADIPVTIWGFLFGWSWILYFGLAFIIWCRFIGLVFFYGLSSNWNEVSHILACNSTILVVIFGFLACGAAYDTLDPTIAGIMGIVYLCLIAFKMLMHFRKDLF